MYNLTELRLVGAVLSRDKHGGAELEKRRQNLPIRNTPRHRSVATV
jgi:hypothetical protein